MTSIAVDENVPPDLSSTEGSGGGGGGDDGDDRALPLPSSSSSMSLPPSSSSSSSQLSTDNNRRKSGGGGGGGGANGGGKRRVHSSGVIAAAAAAAAARGAGVDRPSSSTARKNDETLDKWAKLQNLKNLLNAGFLTKQEYKERKAQLVDELTGTTCTVQASSASRTQRVAARNLPVVVPRSPPDFAVVESEEAVKWLFDIESRKWRSQRIELKLDPTPFSRGALRYVYHMQEVRLLRDDTTDTADSTAAVTSSHTAHSTDFDGGDEVDFTDGTDVGVGTTYVAKISIDPRDQQDRAPYFRDVEMQSLTKFYAKRFNSYNPPKKIDFVKAWIVELVQREGQPICGVERFIDGPYRKHNNNYGYVNDDERSTPQAFSHFTWEASSHNVLVCDIQGVGDMYTDPQIHSLDGVGFGKGNMGEKGIEKFLSSHRCNAVCRYLKLPPINANYAAIGTLPTTGTYMSYRQIAVVNISNQLTDQTPLLPPKKSTVTLQQQQRQHASLTMLSSTGALKPAVAMSGAKFSERQARAYNSRRRGNKHNDNDDDDDDDDDDDSNGVPRKRMKRVKMKDPELGFEYSITDDGDGDDDGDDDTGGGASHRHHRHNKHAPTTPAPAPRPPQSLLDQFVDQFVNFVGDEMMFERTLDEMSDTELAKLTDDQPPPEDICMQILCCTNMLPQRTPAEVRRIAHRKAKVVKSHARVLRQRRRSRPHNQAMR